MKTDEWLTMTLWPADSQTGQPDWPASDPSIVITKLPGPRLLKRLIVTDRWPDSGGQPANDQPIAQCQPSQLVDSESPAELTQPAGPNETGWPDIEHCVCTIRNCYCSHCIVDNWTAQLLWRLENPDLLDSGPDGPRSGLLWRQCPTWRMWTDDLPSWTVKPALAEPLAAHCWPVDWLIGQPDNPDGQWNWWKWTDIGVSPAFGKTDQTWPVKRTDYY